MTSGRSVARISPCAKATQVSCAVRRLRHRPGAMPGSRSVIAGFRGPTGRQDPRIDGPAFDNSDVACCELSMSILLTPVSGYANVLSK